ncbi:HAMP domain-containing histidine kinase [Aeromicrobium sp.]|nr:HAMP domain-containing histidine kinase [Candidatus Saccharibacteria bacterium]
MVRTDQSVSALSVQLLLAVAEQIKLPLLQIARTAELSQVRDTTADLDSIQTTADMAIKLLDSYLFGARLALESDYRLNIEPVSVAAVLYDTGQQLTAMAKLYGVELQLDIAGRFAPVLANRQGLQSAMTSLGYALIEALPSLNAQTLTLHLAVHNSRYGVVAGVYSDAEQLSVEALRQGRKLQGHIRQPLASISPSSGAGIFVADAILQAMSTELRPTRHHNLHGLGAVLRPTPQLQLV